MRVCIAHDIPIQPGKSDCAICRRRLTADPTLTAESLLKPVPNEERSSDARARNMAGMASVRAAMRQAAHTQEPLP